MTPSILGRAIAWILAWLLVLPAFAANSGLTPAGSFAADAALVRERHIPILVFYSRAGCPWCEMVRRSYLVPLAKDPASADRVIIREIKIGTKSDKPLTDFAGRATTHSAFARARRVRLAPTLDFLDDRGDRLADPIVGVSSPDFYGTFIDRAIDEAIAKLRTEPQ